MTLAGARSGSVGSSPRFECRGPVWAMQRGQQGASRAKAAENLPREPLPLSHLLPRGRPGERRMKRTLLKRLLRLLWEIALGGLHPGSRSPGLKQGGGSSLTVAISVHSVATIEGGLPPLCACSWPVLQHGKPTLQTTHPALLPECSF